MNDKGMEMKWADLESIKMCPLEPESRLTDKSILPLIKSIRENIKNGLPPLPDSEVLLIGSDGALGDGHRRRQALLRCGVKNFWIIIDPARTSEQILSHRAEARKHGQKENTEILGAIYKIGLSTDYLPPNGRSALARLKHSTESSNDPDRGPKYAIESGVALTAYHALEQIISHCGMNGDTDFGYNALKWMVDFKAQRKIRILIENEQISSRTLRNCIREHKDLPKL